MTDSTLRVILKPLSDGGYHSNSEDKTRSTCYGCKNLAQATKSIEALIALKVQEARINELRMARSVDSQFSSADIVNHLEYRLSALHKIKGKL